MVDDNKVRLSPREVEIETMKSITSSRPQVMTSRLSVFVRWVFITCFGEIMTSEIFGEANGPA
jgi:hypothetical protein